jgi:hypothetical protein
MSVAPISVNCKSAQPNRKEPPAQEQTEDGVATLKKGLAGCPPSLPVGCPSIAPAQPHDYFTTISALSLPLPLPTIMLRDQSWYPLFFTKISCLPAATFTVEGVLPTKLPSTSISQFGTLASIVSPDRAAAGDRQPKRHRRGPKLRHIELQMEAKAGAGRPA